MQIGHSIGQGSFAMVYKGKERMTGREVAMKVVRAQDQIEFDDGSGGCPDDAYRFALIHHRDPRALRMGRHTQILFTGSCAHGV